MNIGPRNLPGNVCALLSPVIAICAVVAHGAQPRDIAIDGSFADWSAVPPYFDPVNDENQDYHGDAPPPLSENPTYPDHADVDILEYKFAHDENNLYAYFRSRGVIGQTQQQGQGNGRAGRFYVIVTIDVDNDNTTGYELRDGGYWISPDWPLSNGYDMNMEIEFFDGAFNTGHYINHGALSDGELPALEEQQKQGIVDVLPGSYDSYTQWVMFDDPMSGDHDLGDGTSITFVNDRGPVHQGIIRAALSPDGHELEMIAPFNGFMSYPGAGGQRGDLIMGLGRTIDIAFSLEHSGEMVVRPTDPDYPVDWASDTAAPIVGYYLGVPEPSSVIAIVANCFWFGAFRGRQRGSTVGRPVQRD